MKTLTFAGIILAAFLTGAGCMTERYAQYPREQVPAQDSAALMTPQDVIDMSNAGAGDDVIIDMIHKTGSVFQLSPQDVVALADSGVSSRVIRAMIKSDQAPRYSQGTPTYSYDPYWYWYGGYPYPYPWYFGLSVGYYAPFYYHYHGFSVPRYVFSSPRGFVGRGRGFGGMRSVGRRR